FAVKVAQRGVKDGAALGFIDLSACEHCVAAGGDIGLFREPDQKRARLGVDIGLGIVEQETAGLGAESLGAAVMLEKRRDGACGGGLGMARQIFPECHVILPSERWRFSARYGLAPVRRANFRRARLR